MNIGSGGGLGGRQSLVPGGSLVAEVGNVDRRWRSKSSQVCGVRRGFQYGSLWVLTLVPGNAGEGKAETHL